MADRLRYEVNDTQGRWSLVLLSASPLNEAQVTRAAVFLARAGKLKRNATTTIDLGIWTADEMRILEMEAP